MHDGAPLIVVEGYVDVIAMVTAGYPAAVAPLGTALTEEQLGLLWKMADEPILCFDGDKAGQRAAFRAVDLALPRLKPGKSLRFAHAARGPGPRRSRIAPAGARRSPRCCGSARPLADMLWTRETEAASFDTPERRAALEARVHEVVRSIGDESVRKYYAQDFSARLRQLMTPALGRAGASVRAARRAKRGQFGGQSRSGNVRRFRPRRRSWQRGQSNARPPTSPPSARLSASPIVRGFRSALPPREALILVAVINHPWLLEHHAEEFAELEFLNPDADHLRRAILDAATEAGRGRSGGAARGDRRARPDRVLARVEAAITHTSDWPARAGASRRRCGPMVDPRCYLASQAAHVK